MCNVSYRTVLALSGRCSTKINAKNSKLNDIEGQSNKYNDFIGKESRSKIQSIQISMIRKKALNQDNLH